MKSELVVKKLIELRNSEKLTQLEMSKRIGITRSYYCRMEKTKLATKAFRKKIIDYFSSLEQSIEPVKIVTDEMIIERFRFLTPRRQLKMWNFLIYENEEMLQEESKSHVENSFQRRTYNQSKN